MISVFFLRKALPMTIPCRLAPIFSSNSLLVSEQKETFWSFVVMDRILFILLRFQLHLIALVNEKASSIHSFGLFASF